MAGKRARSVVSVDDGDKAMHAQKGSIVGVTLRGKIVRRERIWTD
jgi:hypothetical protein